MKLKRKSDSDLTSLLYKYSLKVQRAVDAVLEIEREQRRRIKEIEKLEPTPWPCGECGWMALSPGDLAIHVVEKHGAGSVKP